MFKSDVDRKSLPLIFVNFGLVLQQTNFQIIQKQFPSGFVNCFKLFLLLYFQKTPQFFWRLDILTKSI